MAAAIGAGRLGYAKLRGLYGENFGFVVALLIGLLLLCCIALVDRLLDNYLIKQDVNEFDGRKD